MEKNLNSKFAENLKSWNSSALSFLCFFLLLVLAKGFTISRPLLLLFVALGRKRAARARSTELDERWIQIRVDLEGDVAACSVLGGGFVFEVIFHRMNDRRELEKTANKRDVARYHRTIKQRKTSLEAGERMLNARAKKCVTTVPGVLLVAEILSFRFFVRKDGMLAAAADVSQITKPAFILQVGVERRAVEDVLLARLEVVHAAAERADDADDGSLHRDDDEELEGGAEAFARLTFGRAPLKRDFSVIEDRSRVLKGNLALAFFEAPALAERILEFERDGFQKRFEVSAVGQIFLLGPLAEGDEISDHVLDIHIRMIYVEELCKFLHLDLAEVIREVGAHCVMLQASSAFASLLALVEFDFFCCCNCCVCFLGHSSFSFEISCEWLVVVVVDCSSFFFLVKKD